MIDILIFISQRPVVITLAILGGLLVTSASLFSNPKQNNQPINGKRIKQEPTKLSKRLIVAGYSVMFVSMALFIIAGFVSDLRP
ncbi:MAG: hypothetical protein ABJM86_05610 [Hyphomicrobiales bacterium]